MTIAQVIDNFFDDVFINEMHQKIMDIPMTPKNTARPLTWPYGYESDYRMQGYTLFNRVNMNRVVLCDVEKSQFFFDILEGFEKKFNKNFYLRKIHINLQHSGCHGREHADADTPNELTMMIMPNSKWKKEWGGEFQILDNDNNVIESHDYVPGRIVLFPGNVLHKGLGPNEEYPYIYRYTLVYRITP